MLHGNNCMSKRTFIILISSIVIALDFITKKIILARVMLHESINVLPFLNIVHVENKGAAFGSFTGLGNNVFIIISIIAIIFILVYLSKVHQKLEFISLSLVLGGAIGNLLDRIQFGKVIDFIDFFVGKWHWPSFNVADSALTVGIILFLISNLRHGRDAKEL
jgi:signal peptidase II